MVLCLILTVHQSQNSGQMITQQWNNVQDDGGQSLAGCKRRISSISIRKNGFHHQTEHPTNLAPNSIITQSSQIRKSVSIHDAEIGTS